MQSLYNPLLFYPNSSTKNFLRCFMWFIILSAKKKTLSWSGSSGLNSHFPEGRAGTQDLISWSTVQCWMKDSRCAALKRLADVSAEATRGRCFLTFAPGCSDPGDDLISNQLCLQGGPSGYQESQVKLQEALTFGLTHQAIQRWIFVSLSKNNISGL